MAKEWGPRNDRETWTDHNLEEGLEFTWVDGEPARITRHNKTPRVYDVAVKGMNRIVTEAFILACMKEAGEDPQIGLHYSAWPLAGDVRKGQKRVVTALIIFFASVLTCCVVAVLLLTR